MSNKQTKPKITSDAVPTPKFNNIGEQDWTPSESVTKFVVVRDNIRVSDKEYLTETDAAALNERDFWQRVINRHPDGTKVNVVQFEKKKHRIW